MRIKKISIRQLTVFIFFTFLVLFPTHQIGQEYVWAETGTDKEYKAITYNIHHGKTKEGSSSIIQMAKELRKENPDFVALQEVERYSVRSGLQDQIKFFAEQLNMYYVYEPTINLGVLQYGNGILSKYPILESGKIELKSKKEPRSILWAKVLTEKGNMFITSIHLGLARQEDQYYFNQIDHFVKEIVGHHPVLIMGDFNALPNNKYLNQFRSQLTGTLFTPMIPTYQHPTKDIQIDYILGKDIRNGLMYYLPFKASDHYPLVKKFKIGSERTLLFNMS